jgi:hypothetical protein
MASGFGQMTKRPATKPSQRRQLTPPCPHSGSDARRCSGWSAPWTDPSGCDDRQAHKDGSRRARCLADSASPRGPRSGTAHMRDGTAPALCPVKASLRTLSATVMTLNDSGVEGNADRHAGKQLQVKDLETGPPGGAIRACVLYLVHVPTRVAEVARELEKQLNACRAGVQCCATRAKSDWLVSQRHQS